MSIPHLINREERLRMLNEDFWPSLRERLIEADDTELSIEWDHTSVERGGRVRQDRTGGWVLTLHAHRMSDPEEICRVQSRLMEEFSGEETD